MGASPCKSQDFCNNIDLLITRCFSGAKICRISAPMKCSRAPASTDGRSVDAQMRQLITVGFRKLLREVARHSNYRSAIIARASGCRSGRAQVLPNCGGIRARLRRIRTGLWYRSDGPWHLCGSRATLHALRLWPCRPWHLMVADDHGPGRLIANMP